MVTLSDKIGEFLVELDAQDHLGYAGIIYYLKELSDENHTYPAGKGVNLLARSGAATAVINGMSIETDSPSVEIWLFGEPGQDMDALLQFIWDRYDGVSCTFHTISTDISSLLTQNGAIVCDETLEFVGQGLRFQLCGEIHKLTIDEMSLLSNSKDEQLALYCGDLPLNADNCHVYGRLKGSRPITVCSIEENYNGFARIVEPIWVYTSLWNRRRGWAQKCVSHGLMGTGSSAIVLYHVEQANRGSVALAEALGLRLNHKCISLDAGIISKNGLLF